MSSLSPLLCSPISKYRSPEFHLQRIPIMGTDGEIRRKPRFLCLHGFRTSGAILKKQVGKWPDSVLEQLDLDFLDAPFPAEGKSDIEGIFDPPYFEWFQFSPVRLLNPNFFRKSQTLVYFVCLFSLLPL